MLDDDQSDMYAQHVYTSWASNNKITTSVGTTSDNSANSFYDSVTSNTASQNIVLYDSMSVDIGDGVVLSGKVLKTCLKN